MAENRSRLRELRKQRAQAALEIQHLEEAARRPVVVPTAEEVRSLLDQTAGILTAAAGSDDEQKLAAARRIVEAVTGGRIVISQQGERQCRKGWLWPRSLPISSNPSSRTWGSPWKHSRRNRSSSIFASRRRRNDWQTKPGAVGSERPRALDQGIARTLRNLRQLIGREPGGQGPGRLVHVWGFRCPMVVLVAPPCAQSLDHLCTSRSPRRGWS